MRNRILILSIGMLALFSCSTQTRLDRETGREIGELKDYCDNIFQYKTLYISKIDSKIELKEEVYKARLSFYYVPDSILFLTAVNAGFEIVRIGISKDSTVYINRLDKIVYVFKNNMYGYSPPLEFYDIELLVNKMIFCRYKTLEREGLESIIIKRSDQNIKKEIYYSPVSFMLQKFEFFHKKTGEYVIGEVTEQMDFLIYSNYIVEDLFIVSSNGIIEYDRDINVDLTVNSKKYSIIYL